MEKEKLLMLPGWSMDSSVWKPVVPFLSEYFNLAFCQWEGLEDKEGYVNRIDSLVEKEEGELCLMGWSLGSLLAIHAASKYPDRIKRLILVSGTSRFTRDKKTHYLCGWPESVLKKMKVTLDDEMEKTINSFHQAMFSAKEREKGSYGDFLATISMGKAQKSTELQAGLDLLLLADNRHLLSDIEVPLLLIHGEKDTICPVGASLYISSRVKGRVLLKILPGAGHIQFFTAAKEFKMSIKEFMEQGA